MSNFLDCTVNPGGEVDIHGQLKIKVPTRKDYTGPAKLSARPEQLFFADEGMPGTVQFSTFLGDFIEYEVQLNDGQNLIVNEYTKDTSEVHEAGEKVYLNFDPQRISVYIADTEEVITC